MVVCVPNTVAASMAPTDFRPFCSDSELAARIVCSASPSSTAALLATELVHCDAKKASARKAPGRLRIVHWAVKLSDSELRLGLRLISRLRTDQFVL